MTEQASNSQTKEEFIIIRFAVLFNLKGKMSQDKFKKSLENEESQYYLNN